MSKSKVIKKVKNNQNKIRKNKDNHNHKGKGKGKKKDVESLDRELASYWIKKGDTENAKAHLDFELDDYWKKENKPNKLDEQALITEDTAVNSQVHSQLGISNKTSIHA